MPRRTVPAIPQQQEVKMLRPVRILVVVLVSCLAAGGCLYQSFAFRAPAQVPGGSVFVVEVEAQFSGAQGMPPAAVFQIPDGFEFVGASAVARGATTLSEFVDAGGVSPPMNFSWLPAWPPNVEPGHHLLWFSANSSQLIGVPSTGRLKLYLRAPTAAGSHALKLALGHRSIDSKFGYPYQHALPVGSSGFATMVAPAHVRPIQVIAAAPPPPFALVTPPSWVVGGPLPRQIALGDVDADGRADLVERYDQTLRVLLARPGGWVPAASLTVPAGGGHVEVADHDGDAFADFVFANGTVYFGDGGTTWTPAPVLSHGLPAAAVAVGDVDGDGRHDVVFVDATGCVVFRANADRTFVPFGAGLPASTSASPGRVLVDDLDGDGNAEILRWSLPGQPVQLWRSDGLGNWLLAGTLSFPGAPPHGIDDDPFVLLDLDGDGRREVVRTGSATAYAYSGTGVVPVAVTAFGFERAVALDHDRDGRQDLVVSSSAGGASPLVLWRNTAAGFSSTALPADQGFGALGRTLALRTGDIDGDSFPDLAASLLAERPLVWRNTVTGAARYGRGCAGTGMASSVISAPGAVVPGQSTPVQVSGALPNGPGLLWAGLSRRTWAGLPLLPMDLTFVGAPGCELLAEPSVAVPWTADANGVMTMLVPLPPLLPTDALTFFLQGAVLAPGANPLQFLFSDGLALKMQ